jgi:hypothetical protein
MVFGHMQRKLFIVLIALGIASIVLARPYIPFRYPLFMQCDPRWGQDLMGGTNPTHDTICIQGCAMSSVSMALNGKGYTINGTEINPGTLNKWLRAHHGYHCISGNCNNLVLDAPNGISPDHIKFISEEEKPTVEVIKGWITRTNPVAIAHIQRLRHFVLVIGFDRDNRTAFYVNDPFYHTNIYDYSDISDIITYQIDKH